MLKRCVLLWRKTDRCTRKGGTAFGGCNVEKEGKVLAVWRQGSFELKMLKTLHFGGSDVEKVHAIVVRSTF